MGIERDITKLLVQEKTDKEVRRTIFVEWAWKLKSERDKAEVQAMINDRRKELDRQARQICESINEPKETAIVPCEDASYYSCDYVAECMKVSKNLYDRLWAVTAVQEAVGEVIEEDCGSSHEFADCNGLLVSQNWDKFTNDEKAELNKALEGK